MENRITPMSTMLDIWSAFH